MTQFKVGQGVFQLSLNKALALAQDGDTIQLASGSYHLESEMGWPLKKAITFEAQDHNRPVKISGRLDIVDTSCVFKHLTFICQEIERPMILATRAQLMFEHCQFYGERTPQACAIQLSQSYCTIYSGVFSQLTGNAVKANSQSQVMIYHSSFNDLQASSALYLDRSTLNIQSSQFLNVTTSAINAIGECQINACDCDWEVSAQPALYLNPKVHAEIRHSRFFGRRSAIFARQASVIIKSCQFRDAKNAVKPPAPVKKVTEHLFKNSEDAFAIELKDSQLALTDSTFLLTIHAIEAVGISQIDAQRCSWYHEIAPVLFLYPEGQAKLSDCRIQGKNAIICVQKATFFAKNCQFIGISDNHTIRAKQQSGLDIKDCLFSRISNFAAISLEEACLDLQRCRFTEMSVIDIEVIGDNHITAADCVWDDSSKSAIKHVAEAALSLSSSAATKV